MLDKYGTQVNIGDTIVCGDCQLVVIATQMLDDVEYLCCGKTEEETDYSLIDAVTLAQSWCELESYEFKRIDMVRAGKLQELSEACHAEIVNGVDVDFGGNTFHFSMGIEDQLNIASLSTRSAMGESVPYHADGCPCRFFTPEEFSGIVNACLAHKLFAESYYNSLKAWVLTCETADEIEGIAYGDEIPEDYQSDVFRALTQKGGEDDCRSES